MRRIVIAAGLGGLLVLGTITAVQESGAASSGNDGGNTVRVGASDGGSSPGWGGTPGGSGGGAFAGNPGPTGGSGGGTGSGTGSGASAVSCTYMALTLSDIAFPPGGATPGGWYSVSCYNPNGTSLTQTEWITTASPATPTAQAPAAPAVDPRVLALQADESLHLPAPVLELNPEGSTVVNLPTWLWLAPGLWHSYSVSATAGSVTATAVATPLSVRWSMGDGGTVTCGGPGTPYAAGAVGQSTTCSYTYRDTSTGQPSPDGDENDGAFTVNAVVTWGVTWASVGAPGGGTLPDLTTQASTGERVTQIQSVDADGVVTTRSPVSPTEWER